MVLTSLLALGCSTDIAVDSSTLVASHAETGQPTDSGSPSSKASPEVGVDETDGAGATEIVESGASPDDIGDGGWFGKELTAVAGSQPEVPEVPEVPEEVSKQEDEISSVKPPKKERVLFPWETPTEEASPADSEALGEVPAGEAEAEPIVADEPVAMPPESDPLPDLFADAAEEMPKEAFPTEQTPVPSAAEEEAEEALPVETVAPKPESPPLDFFPAPSIDRENTQHLAWLLGLKMSESLLTPNVSDAQVVDEVRSISQFLDMELSAALPMAEERSGSAGETAADEVQRIRQWLNMGRELGTQLANKHDARHAALMEVGFKSNLMRAIYPSKPHLVPAVGKSIATASTKAGLPDDWGAELQDEVAASASISELETSVTKFCARVDEYLRQSFSEGSDSVAPFLR